jgi:hypothetical protein
MVIGRIGSKYIEAIPASVGLQFDGRPALDPALRWHRIMQQMGCIDKIDLAIALHGPLFSA